MKHTLLLIALLVPRSLLFAQGEASKINSDKDNGSEVLQAFKNKTFNASDFIAKAAQLGKPEYKKGILHHKTYYDQDGILQLYLPYKNNRLEGEITFYTKSGAPFSKVLYKKGIPIVGTATEFITAVNFIQTSYEAGKIYEISTFQNYKIQERQIFNLEESYTVTRFYDNEQPKFEYQIAKNYLDGKVVYYSKKGLKLYEAEFYDGTLVSGEIWLSNSGSKKTDYVRIIKDATNQLIAVPTVSTTSAAEFMMPHKIAPEELYDNTLLSLESYNTPTIKLEQE
ncbi:hypothetical protein [Flavobacterium kingsejongi]|nr:hypothetical protein [Flavobacterium kingsejongi]